MCKETHQKLYYKLFKAAFCTMQNHYFISKLLDETLSVNIKQA